MGLSLSPSPAALSLSWAGFSSRVGSVYFCSLLYYFLLKFLNADFDALNALFFLIVLWGFFMDFFHMLLPMILTSIPSKQSKAFKKKVGGVGVGGSQEPKRTCETTTQPSQWGRERDES